MQFNVKFLQSIPLFRGIVENEFEDLFACVGAKKETYGKGDFIFLNGNVTGSIGIVLTGRVQIIKEDIFGNRAILSVFEPKAMFGESFVCGGSYALTVSAQSVENSDILFFPFERVMNMCPSACGFHNTMIKNMVEMLALKNIKLVEKLEVTTKHSIREKMLTYLSQLVQEQGSATVTSPMGKMDLADFLGVDRSALTRELNRMRDAGLVKFERNIYTLIDVDLP